MGTEPSPYTLGMPSPQETHPQNRKSLMPQSLQRVVQSAITGKTAQLQLADCMHRAAVELHGA